MENYRKNHSNVSRIVFTTTMYSFLLNNSSFSPNKKFANLGKYLKESPADALAPCLFTKLKNRLQRPPLSIFL